MTERQEVEWQLPGTGGRGGETGSYCLVGAEFQFCKMLQVLEKDGGEGCTTMQTHLMSLNRTLRNG